jgi:hypothetical protein
MDQTDVETILLRLLCEKAEDRLERVRMAAEQANRRLSLPGSAVPEPDPTTGHASAEPSRN